MHKWAFLFLSAFGALLATAGPVAAAVTVFPSPGTRAASYKTQISFRDVDPRAIGRVRVDGSRSGSHSGRLRRHSDGKGASLVFSEPFRRNESVAVRTGLDIVDGKKGDFRFKVVGLGNASLIVQEGRKPPSQTGAGDRRRFRSRPDLAPPTVSVERRDGAQLAPGVLALNGRNFTGRGQQGPMLLDDDGELIWWKAAGNGERVMDVRVQTYRDKPVITWWQGRARAGGGSGDGIIYDTAYKPVKKVRAGNGYRVDLHEFLITPQDTALIPIYNPYGADLSSIGGSRNGLLVDSIVQEIDIATGLVLFEWHSVGNVDIEDSYTPAPEKASSRHDYFHLNSITVDGKDGNLLVSGRDTRGVYKLDRRTGRIIWTMGGKKNDFARGKGATFAFQHDAAREADGTISVFDNSAAPPVAEKSRALFLDVDEEAMRVELRQAISHPDDLLAATQGSVQLLPNGNRLVGWGSQRHFSEHAPDGKLLLDGTLTRANDSYRTVRSPWPGLPRTGPSLLADARGEGTTIYASYNGAVGVARWEVLAGSSADALKPVGTGARKGFETQIDVEAEGPFFAVRALAADGRQMGRSKAERRR